MQEQNDFVKNRTFKNIIVNALENDGVHHKQWYLEQLLIKLGFDLDQVRKEERADGYDWDPGIAP